MRPLAHPITAISIAVGIAATAFAADDDIRLEIRNHRFEPQEVHLTAGRKIRLVVTNRDATAEEFESHDLNREKVIAGGASAVIHIGPLSPGRYSFVGEFHEDTAHGVVVVE